MRAQGRKRLLRLSLVSLALVPVLGIFLLFNGDLDSGGHYRILQTVPSIDGKTAFEVERTDNQALDGARYAVVIDDHVPSTVELKRALISFWRKRGSFELADQSVRITWSGPNLLTVTTDAPGTNPDWLLKQQHRIGNVAIRYSGRP